jgi:hypothetical protein
LDFLDRGLCGVDVVEHNEGLAFCLEILLCYDLEDRAVFIEELGECFFQFIRLDALFEVLDLQKVREEGRNDSEEIRRRCTKLAWNLEGLEGLTFRWEDCWALRAQGAAR